MSILYKKVPLRIAIGEGNNFLFERHSRAPVRWTDLTVGQQSQDVPRPLSSRRWRTECGPQKGEEGNNSPEAGENGRIIQMRQAMIRRHEPVSELGTRVDSSH